MERKITYLHQPLSGNSLWSLLILQCSLVSGFLHCLASGDFLVAFVVTRKCLQFLKPLTVNLQKSEKDIVAAYKEIADLTRSIHDLRREIDTIFRERFAEANDMSQSMIGRHCETTSLQTPRRTSTRGLWSSRFLTISLVNFVGDSETRIWPRTLFCWFQ